MKKTQKGGFLLETLLILAVIITIMPFLVEKLADRKILKENIATEQYIETLFNASKTFIVEGQDTLPAGNLNLEGNSLRQFLEPYGLPSGFNFKSPLGQNISLFISKGEDDIFAVLSLSDGKKHLSQNRKLELALRIGYFAGMLNDDGMLVGATGGWEENPIKYSMNLSGKNIYILIPNSPDLNEMVSRKKIGFSTEQQKMHVNLNMGNNDISSVAIFEANKGDFDSVETTEIKVTADSDSGIENKIGQIIAKHLIFSNNSESSDTGLTINNSGLLIDNLSVKNIGKSDNLGLNLSVSEKLSVANFETTDIKNLSTIEVRENLISADKDLNLIDYSGGKLVVHKQLVSPIVSNESSNEDNSDSLTYIYSPIVYSDYIGFFNTSSTSLAGDYETSPIAIIDFNKSTIVPEIRSDNFNNDNIKILESIEGDSENSGFAKEISCQDFIKSLDVTYNSKSLSQRMICLNVKYYRLWVRAKIKNCMNKDNNNTYEACKIAIKDY